MFFTGNILGGHEATFNKKLPSGDLIKFSINLKDVFDTIMLSSKIEEYLIKAKEWNITDLRGEDSIRHLMVGLREEKEYSLKVDKQGSLDTSCGGYIVDLVTGLVEKEEIKGMNKEIANMVVECFEDLFDCYPYSFMYDAYSINEPELEDTNIFVYTPVYLDKLIKSSLSEIEYGLVKEYYAEKLDYDDMDGHEGMTQTEIRGLLIECRKNVAKKFKDVLSKEKKSVAV